MLRIPPDFKHLCLSIISSVSSISNSSGGKQNSVKISSCICNNNGSTAIVLSVAVMLAVAIVVVVIVVAKIVVVAVVEVQE